MPNLPNNIVATNIAGVKLPGKSLGNPYGPGNSTPQIKIVLELNPLKSAMLVGRLGVIPCFFLRETEACGRGEFWRGATQDGTGSAAGLI